jgi:hypothetical protein
MDPSLEKEFSDGLGLAVERLAFIQENAYCAIYRAECDGEAAIIKKYKGDDPRLASLEARAVDFYHELVADRPAILDSRTIRFEPAHNLVCISFVPGISFADYLYAVRGDAERQRQAVQWMTLLAELLEAIRLKTSDPSATTDPFLFEYFDYCTRRLRSIPLLGATAFRREADSGGQIVAAFRAAAPVPSFIHGDFVFRNIHVHGDRIGLIDFANTNAASHVLNDVYNLQIGLGNMLLPAAFKRELWTAFEERFDPARFDAAVHRFYFEYHRRRWLMLNWRTGDPRRWLRALRGMNAFARPWPEGTRSQ